MQTAICFAFFYIFPHFFHCVCFVCVGSRLFAGFCYYYFHSMTLDKLMEIKQSKKLNSKLIRINEKCGRACVYVLKTINTSHNRKCMLGYSTLFYPLLTPHLMISI